MSNRWKDDSWPAGQPRGTILMDASEYRQDRERYEARIAKLRATVTIARREIHVALCEGSTHDVACLRVDDTLAEDDKLAEAAKP